MPQYWDLGTILKPVEINFKENLFTIDLVVDSARGFRGFTSHLSEDVMKGPLKWSGLDI